MVRRESVVLPFVALIGTVLAALSTAGPAKAQSLDPAQQLEQRFIQVAKRVGPAVVSISTEAVERGPMRRPHFRGSPFSEFEEDLFEHFFRDFFGEMPEQEFRQRGLGTGVIIDSEGYILTNEHVVHGADKVVVTLPDGREFRGQIKGTDFRSDLAVIQIDAKELPAAELGDSEKVVSGQWAIAVGNPFGWAVGGTEPTITVGVISALHRSIRMGRMDRDYSDLIQTDAAINPGNSGGPLVNLAGEVIGINVAIFSTTGGYQGIGFAIPVNSAKAVVGDLIEGKKILYGWLGVHIQDVNEELARAFQLSGREGAIVIRVIPDSPAEKAGLRDGDVIVAYAGEPVKNVRELLKLSGRTRVGQKVNLQVIREGKEVRVPVEVGERPQELAAWGERGQGSWRGLEVSGLTPELAQQFQVPFAEGVIVTQVEPGSPADEAGVRIGDLVLEVNRRRVRSVQEFAQIAASVRGDALLKARRGFFVVREGN